MSGSDRFSWRLLLWALCCLMTFLLFVFCAHYAIGLNTVAKSEERGSHVYGPNHK